MLRRDVAAQSLVESSLLTVAGGLLGSVLGLPSSALIQVFTGWPAAVHPLMLVAALVVALAVGIGIGFHPAWHAAGLAMACGIIPTAWDTDPLGMATRTA